MRLSPRCRAIISGQDRDIFAVLVRLLLWLPSQLYGFVMLARNGLYSRGWSASAKLSVKVVCVGNITAGGTGKTPMVVWLCRELAKRGKRIAILSRGYKSADGGDNDEVRLLRQALPDVPIVVDRDRLRGGRKAITEHNAEILVLDDGFQHRRLQRDMDIVLIDCTCPFGYGAMLPRGLLREPLSSLKRADAILLTRSDMVPTEELSRIKQRIAKLQKHKPTKSCRVLTAEHKPVALSKADDEKLPLSELTEKRILAVCGIGNPDAFVQTLTKLDAQVVDTVFYDDHYAYQQQDIAVWQNKKRQSNAELIVTTEKDWVKIKQLQGSGDLLSLRIEMTFAGQEDKMQNLLDDIITPKAACN